MILNWQRHTKHHHDRVANIFIQCAAFRLQGIGHRTEVLIHQRHQFIGRQLL